MPFSFERFEVQLRTMTTTEMALAFKRLELEIGNRLVAAGIPSDSVDTYIPAWAAEIERSVSFGQQQVSVPPTPPDPVSELGEDASSEDISSEDISGGDISFEDDEPSGQRGELDKELRLRIVQVLDTPMTRRQIHEALGDPDVTLDDLSAHFAKETTPYWLTRSKGSRKWRRGASARRYMRTLGETYPRKSRGAAARMVPILLSILKSGEDQHLSSIYEAVLALGYSDWSRDHVRLILSKHHAFKRTHRGRYRAVNTNSEPVVAANPFETKAEPAVAANPFETEEEDPYDPIFGRALN